MSNIFDLTKQKIADNKFEARIKSLDNRYLKNKKVGEYVSYLNNPDLMETEKRDDVVEGFLNFQ